MGGTVAEEQEGSLGVRQDSQSVYIAVAKLWQLAPMLWTGCRNDRLQWAPPKGWRSRFGWGECRVGKGSCPQWLRPLHTPQARIWRGWLAIRPGVRPPSSGPSLRWLDDMSQPSTHHPGKPPPARVEVPEGLHGQQLGGPAVMLRRTTKGQAGFRTQRRALEQQPRVETVAPLCPRGQARLCCYKKSVSIYKKSEKLMKLQYLDEWKFGKNENYKTIREIK